MAVAQKGAITFGLVYIPVDLYTAVQDNNIRFNQLDRESHRRVRYKKVVEGENRELAQKDIIKGYEYEKGKYVVITDDEMEAIKGPEHPDFAVHRPVFHTTHLLRPALLRGRPERGRKSL